MLMPERSETFGSSGYRFGFNGKEQDDEVKGNGNSLDYGARIYDSRLGRWMSIDPLQQEYPNYSPYNYVANNPVFYIDADGKKFINPHKGHLDEAKTKLDKKQVIYENMVSIHEGKLKNKDIRNYKNKSGLSQAKRDYNNVQEKHQDVEELLYTLKKISPEDYDYFNTLTDTKGNEIDIKVIAFDNLSPRGELNFAETKLVPTVINANESSGTYTTGVVNNEISIYLYSNGRNLRSFSNELGDIKYIEQKVFGKDKVAFDLWRTTSGASGEGQSESNYRNNKKGAGYYSFEYDKLTTETFENYIKKKKLSVDKYDSIKQILYNEEFK
jgi:RHS repeat-associated protein